MRLQVNIIHLQALIFYFFVVLNVQIGSLLSIYIKY